MRFVTANAGQQASCRCGSPKHLGHEVTVSANKSVLGSFHGRDDSNSCWVLLHLTFIARAVITMTRMRCYGHIAHGTSPSVRS